jgi:hypothetical protein
MARSIRKIYPQSQGAVQHNVNWGPIHEDSTVIITACEIDLRREGGGGKTPGRPFLGAANVYVSNVAPHNPEGGDGGVGFVTHAEWGSPIDLAVTITVLEDVEQVDFVR